MDYILQYNKAIVALVVPAILYGLNYYGVTPDNEVVKSLEILIGAFIVYLVPNKKV